MAMKLSPCKKVLSLLLALAAAALSAILVVSACVADIAAPRLLSAAQAAELKGVDCILVLGCQVLDDGTPSLMLRDRLDTAIALYEAGAAPKLLMSGDHSREDYDEVGAMKRYAMAAGVPSEDIFLDHAGFSTYESIYRAKALFGAEKILIVTQEYHLYRAVYIAQKLGLEAWGERSLQLENLRRSLWFPVLSQDSTLQENSQLMCRKRGVRETGISSRLMGAIRII